MKKVSLLFALAMIIFFANAQINVISGGNVGIGDNTPAALLTVGTGDKFQVNSSGYVRSIDGSQVLPTYSFTGLTNTGMFRSGTSSLGFATGSSEKMTINSIGNVGIGDNTPASLLTVGNGDLFQITSSGYARSVNGNVSNPTYSFTGSTNTGIYSSGTGILNFSTGGIMRMQINSSGNIQINSSTLNLANLNIYNNQTGSQRGIYLDIEQNANYYQTMTTKCHRSLSMNYVVNLDSIGDQFYVAGAGWIYSQGNYLGSDLNIKDDIFTLDSALTKINAIRGVRYKLKKEKQHLSQFGGNAKEYMGVIAQEVEAVAPQAVMTFSDGTKGVCYEMLVGLLIEAIKEQQVTINSQVERINILSNDVANCCNIEPTAKSMNQIQSSNNQEMSPVLYQNVPNPFNSKTSIRFYLPEETGSSSLLIFDMNGKLIKTYHINNTGEGNIEIHAGELQPGMYMYSLVTNGKEIDTKKMILTE